MLGLLHEPRWPPGNKFDGALVFTKPWSETTDMQARPGARRFSDFAQVSDHGISPP